jgi:transglutaminase-like putative cysteine protease
MIFLNPLIPLTSSLQIHWDTLFLQTFIPLHLPMTFKISSELSYDVFSPTTFFFNIHAAKTAGQQVISESLRINPLLNVEEFVIAGEGARWLRLEVEKESSFTISYEAVVDVQYQVIDNPESLVDIPVIKLEPAVLPFLLPSRHCQSDQVRNFAIKHFGAIHNRFQQVSAINDWIYDNTNYTTGTTDSGTSAVDTLVQGEGVCKDFAHLGIAFCRALDIPARYFTGYASQLTPPDFHACFEAYIGGHWIFFDPTKLVPANGLVKIANSKDAAEAAVANFFGNTRCTYMQVTCSADASFDPMLPGLPNGAALSYS